MDLGISDADWVSRGTSYILLWLSLILVRSLVFCNTFEFPTPCLQLSCVRVCSPFVLSPSDPLVGLAPGSPQVTEKQNL